jgi:hypothetical protein
MTPSQFVLNSLWGKVRPARTFLSIGGEPLVHLSKVRRVDEVEKQLEVFLARSG